MFRSFFLSPCFHPFKYFQPDLEKRISWLLNDQFTEIICTYFVHCIKIFRPGAVARSVECPIRLQAVRSRSSRLAHSFIIMYIFPLPLIQEERIVSYRRKNGHYIRVNFLREACQGRMWLSSDMTSVDYRGCKATNQTTQNSKCSEVTTFYVLNEISK